MDPNTPIDAKVQDTGEFFENQSQINALNAKRTYDEFLDLSLTAARRSQTFFDAMMTATLQNMQNIVANAQSIREQSFRHSENTNETSEMSGKQALRHADIAIAREWNPVDQGVANELTGDATHEADEAKKGS